MNFLDAEPTARLIQLQLAAWKTDPNLGGAHLYLLDTDEHPAVQATRMEGSPPLLEPSVVENLLQQALLDRTTGWRHLFPQDIEAAVLPIRQERAIIGVAVLYPAENADIPDEWSTQVARFAAEFGKARMLNLSEPPTFEQLVQAIPETDEGWQEPEESKVHWEQSRSRAQSLEDLLQDDLPDCLLCDALPLF